MAQLRESVFFWGQEMELSLEGQGEMSRQIYYQGVPRLREYEEEFGGKMEILRFGFDNHPDEMDEEGYWKKHPRGPDGPESWYSSRLDDATPVIWQALYGGGEYETFGANDLLTVVEAGLDMLNLGIEIEIPELVVRGKGSGEMAFQVESIREAVKRMVKDTSFSTRSGSFATAKAARRLSEMSMEAGGYLDNRAVLELVGHGDLEGRVVSYRVDVSRRQMLVLAKLAGWKGDRGSDDGLHLTRRMRERYKERLRRDSAIAVLSRRVGWRMAIEEVDEMGARAAVILYRTKKGDLDFYRERNSTFSKLALRTESSYIQRTAYCRYSLIQAERYVRDHEGRTLEEYLYDEDGNDLNRSIEELVAWEEDNVWLPYGQYTEMGYPLHLPFGNLIRQMEHDSRPHNLPDKARARRSPRGTSAHRNPDACPRCPLEKCTCGYERKVLVTVPLTGTFVAYIELVYYRGKPRVTTFEVKCHCKSNKGRKTEGFWNWCPNCFGRPGEDEKLEDTGFFFEVDKNPVHEEGNELRSRLAALTEADEAEAAIGLIDCYYILPSNAYAMRRVKEQIRIMLQDSDWGDENEFIEYLSDLETV